MSQQKIEMVSSHEALPGRAQPILASNVKHAINQRSLGTYFPDDCETVLFGMGCFWGAEKLFWSLDGVWVTSVGYSAGYTPNPTYQEVCSGLTGHNEVVQVVYQPSLIAFEVLLGKFWQGHNPTQGMRQGNDIGTQYRSGIYTQSSQQEMAAAASMLRYQQALSSSGYGQITTEIVMQTPYYLAEEYHQQYLFKNPDGYCGLGGLGIDYNALA